MFIRANFIESGRRNKRAAAAENWRGLPPIPRRRRSCYHCAMFFAPFLAFYAAVFFFILLFFFVLLEIHVITFAFQAIGLPPELAFLALLASLIGSYINIPIKRIECGEMHTEPIVKSFGVRYRVPAHYGDGSTILAVNVGGAVVPVLISVYVLMQFPAVAFQALLGAAIVALIVHRSARPVPGMGIATPMLIPPIVAAICGYILGGPGHHADVVAFVSGVLGTLIGADLLNLNKIRDLGAPVASIGGAGPFDGLFLTG
ncbi:MAG TPA: DUF1614 domain-containing protein, partial [Candidatus Binataceae bacterium]|nr:DUF1614 domain-containing protein [Candidatus Binataceae bacterium]